MEEDSIQTETSSEPRQFLGSSIEGRRIIDVVYLYSKLKEIAKHGPMDCGLGCIEIVGERQCAVPGIIAIGCGHSQLEELSAALNLPIMSPKTYKTCHCKLSAHWEKVSVKAMNEAANKESAIAEGRVDKNGIPIIDVIVDGCWCKRTYKKNYSALPGAAPIIGRRTGEVLFLGVKNKYCSICAQAQKKSATEKPHLLQK
ncbi:unnamed protein product, partial [Brenthis ino]